MGSDILTTIIAVEREIQERLAAEERRGADMLKNLRRELEEEIAREKERLTASVRQGVVAARMESQERADAVVRRATLEAEHLGGLDDGVLSLYLMKHLARIAGGEDR